MILECLPTGMFGSNIFIIGNQGVGIAIDCGTDSDEIIAAAKKHNLEIKYVILTHGHIDHICSVDDMRSKIPIEVMIHEADAEALTNPVYNVSQLLGSGAVFGNADRLLKDGDILEIGGMRLEIIHTPGHTPGCICIKVGNVLFTGDTLFKAGIGRTDLPGGNDAELQNSIKSRLFILNDEICVYPGHGYSTTIGYEKSNNPYIR